MSIHLVSKGCYRVVIWSKGKRTDRIVKGTKAQAEKLAAELRLELATKPAAANAVPTLEEFCEGEYWPHASRRLRASTKSRKRSHLVHILAELGDLRLDEITAKVLDGYVELRLDDELQPVSVNNELRTLLRVLRFAADDRQLPIRVPRYKRLSEAGREKVTAWTQEQLDRLLTSVEKVAKPILPLVLFIANTGARRGEALAMRCENVDLDRRIFRIWSFRRTDERTDSQAQSWSPKNGKSREVPISASMLPWLTKERLAGEWLFPVPETGSRYAYWPQRLFDRARDDAGLEGGVHRLRHTFASHFLAKEPDMFLLAQVLGHSYTQVTERYSHLLPSHLARARDVVSISVPSADKASANTSKPPDAATSTGEPDDE